MGMSLAGPGGWPRRFVTLRRAEQPFPGTVVGCPTRRRIRPAVHASTTQTVRRPDPPLLSECRLTRPSLPRTATLGWTLSLDVSQLVMLAHDGSRIETSPLRKNGGHRASPEHDVGSSFDARPPGKGVTATLADESRVADVIATHPRLIATPEGTAELAGGALYEERSLPFPDSHSNESETHPARRWRGFSPGTWRSLGRPSESVFGPAHACVYRSCHSGCTT